MNPLVSEMLDAFRVLDPVMVTDIGSHGCLRCLNCLQASRLTPEQIDGWRQTFSGLHDCPALRLVPA